MARPSAFAARRIAQMLPAPARIGYTASARSFASTARVGTAERTPALADVVSDGAAEFERKQEEFRENLSAAKKKADRAFPIPHAPAQQVNSTSQVDHNTPTSNVATDPSGPILGLGSYSSASAEDFREAARRADESTDAPANSSSKGKGLFGNLIYGTEAAREMDREIEQSFSQTLARGKYVHSIVFHEVKPDKVDEYVDLVGGWYPKVAADPKNKVHLVGSWRTEVGDCDTFVHIWEYQRYHGYHDSLSTIQHGRKFHDFDNKLKSLIYTKKMSLMQEFSFWPTTPPRRLGGVFELRSYELHPGNLLEWETHWRKGLAARREVMEGVGAWFVQIGDLNTVHHLWQFANLEERKTRREQSWAHEGWSDTVHKTVPLIQSMKSRILVPMPWSPVG